MPWRNEIQQQHENRKSDALWRTLSTVQSPPERKIRIGGETLLNFCSNNYLSLANHPALIAAATDAVKQFGTSPSASHLIVGHTALHDQLENAIAEFVGAEKVILFSTGYMANLAVPGTMLARHDLMVQDRLNHASIIDGGKLTAAKVRRYPHCDTAAAEKLLANSDHRRKILVTDGVFSMDGDVAPIATLKEICQRHRSMLLVDDAHGFGVVGTRGQGALEMAGGKAAGNVLLLGTLSKACGSFGAFIAGDGIYVDQLTQHARSYIYTTALPCSVVAASLKGIELIQTQAWRREKLNENIQFFREQAKRTGIAVTASATAIQPILLGEAQLALDVSASLRAKGFNVVAIRPPTVPVAMARLRITLMTDHTEKDIRQLLQCLADSLNTLPIR